MIYLFLSLIFQILFNFSISYLNFKTINFVFILLSMVFLSIFLLFLEKIKDKKQKLVLLIVQIIFSIIFNLYLIIFTLPLSILLFKNVKDGINISKIIFFILFLAIPFVYAPLQETIIEKSLALIEPEIKKIIVDQIKISLKTNSEYVKSIALFGFNFAVDNLKVVNKSEAEIIKNIMLEQIENQTEHIEDSYVQKYSDEILKSLKKFIMEYKLPVSIIILLFLYYSLNIYFLFVVILYEILKKTISKYL